MSIVEKEIFRETLFRNLVSKVSKDLVIPLKHSRYVKGFFGHKEVSHFVLRYFLLLISIRNKQDDPVFILGNSELLEKQISDDFTYFKIKKDPKEYCETIQLYIKESIEKLDNSKFNNDKESELKDGFLFYDNKKICKDTGNLGKKFPKFVNYAIALNLRYTYMGLTTHGLARNYEEFGLKTSSATEAFASAFNHYFDHYCSAFPDLEKVYGSIGSFFSMKSTDWKTSLVFVNPPFDNTLIEEVCKKCYKQLRILLKKSENETEIEFEDEDDNEKDEKKEILSFIFTLPNWTKPPFPALEEMKKSKYKTDDKFYRKGELKFIDHMQNGKIIYPCDIWQITISV